jgi:hypothetical protein
MPVLVPTQNTNSRSNRIAARACVGLMRPAVGRDRDSGPLLSDGRFYSLDKRLELFRLSSGPDAGREVSAEIAVPSGSTLIVTIKDGDCILLRGTSSLGKFEGRISQSCIRSSRGQSIAAREMLNPDNGTD